MQNSNLLMGCLSSRSAVAPSESSSFKNKLKGSSQKSQLSQKNNGSIKTTSKKDIRVTNNNSSQKSIGDEDEDNQYDIDDNVEYESGNKSSRQRSKVFKKDSKANNNFNKQGDNSSLISAADLISLINSDNVDEDINNNNNNSSSKQTNSQKKSTNMNKYTNNDDDDVRDNGIDDISNAEIGEDYGESALDIETLENYLIVDFETTQLEEKESLRQYDEKIEQLENLERELSLINEQIDEIKSYNNKNNNRRSIKGSELGLDIEDTTQQGQYEQTNKRSLDELLAQKQGIERQRVKLKKEIEIVIVECDKLQQSYKKRDAILDKLFDGNAGSDLENHLEQQLNWLLEQKQFVDQVFYAWKRAETLTSQASKQFSTALEKLRQLAKTKGGESRRKLARNIRDLLIKSREDMDHAQRYNQNVDAPFFTENETLNYDKIIDKLLDIDMSSNDIDDEEVDFKEEDLDDGDETRIGGLLASDYKQLVSITQFAYQRSITVHKWLEQILQTTISRDSFELVEEYKWIAIQLRKERINLIQLALQEPAFNQLAQSVRKKLVQKHQQQQKSNGSIISNSNKTGKRQTNISTATKYKQQQQQVNKQAIDINDDNKKVNSNSNNNNNNDNGKVTRDSGIESEVNDIEIEEEIYRLLESSKYKQYQQLQQQNHMTMLSQNADNMNLSTQNYEKMTLNSSNNNNSNNNLETTTTNLSNSLTQSAESKGMIHSSASPLRPSQLKLDINEESRRDLQSK